MGATVKDSVTGEAKRLPSLSSMPWGPPGIDRVTDDPGAMPTEGTNSSVRPSCDHVPATGGSRVGRGLFLASGSSKDRVKIWSGATSVAEATGMDQATLNFATADLAVPAPDRVRATPVPVAAAATARTARHERRIRERSRRLIGFTRRQNTSALCPSGHRVGCQAHGGHDPVETVLVLDLSCSPPIPDVEGVQNVVAQRGDPRRGDVEALVAERCGDPVQQADDVCG